MKVGWLLAMTMLGMPQAVSVRRNRARKDPEPTPPRPSPEDSVCTRADCRAGSGEPCNPRTLGRRAYHLARMEAWRNPE